MPTNNRLKDLERQLKLKKKERDKAARIENETSEAWKKKWGPFLDALKAELEILEERLAKFSGTKEEMRRVKTLRDFVTYTQPSSQKKKEAKSKKQALDEDLLKIANEISMVKSEEDNRAETEDQIVRKMFAANDRVMDAKKEFAKLEQEEFYPYVDKMTASRPLKTMDGLMQITASQAKKMILLRDLAGRAFELIESYYARVQKNMSEVDQMMFDITRHIFLEHKTFKPGRMFSKFISMHFDPDIQPEFSEAKKLILQSIQNGVSARRTELRKRATENDKLVWVNKP